VPCSSAAVNTPSEERVDSLAALAAFRSERSLVFGEPLADERGWALGKGCVGGRVLAGHGALRDRRSRGEERRAGVTVEQEEMATLVICATRPSSFVALESDQRGSAGVVVPEVWWTVWKRHATAVAQRRATTELDQ